MKFYFKFDFVESIKLTFFATSRRTAPSFVEGRTTLNHSTFAVVVNSSGKKQRPIIDICVSHGN